MDSQPPLKPQWKPNRRDTIVMTIETAAFIVQLVICFLFYNWLRLTFLVYLGVFLILVAMVLGWRARFAFQSQGRVPEGEKWMRTQVVVASGIYGVVRHPMYLSFMLISLGMMGISQHWLSVIAGMGLLWGSYDDMKREERGNIEKFGDDYLRYMQEVPRMNLIAGALRQLRRRGK